MITELFYSRVLNMNGGSLLARSFSCLHFSVLRYRWTKNGNVSLRGFRDTGHCSQSAWRFRVPSQLSISTKQEKLNKPFRCLKASVFPNCRWRWCLKLEFFFYTINITQVKKVRALFGVHSHVPYISNVSFKSFHETSIENGCRVGKNSFLSINHR